MSGTRSARSSISAYSTRSSIGTRKSAVSRGSFGAAGGSVVGVRKTQKKPNRLNVSRKEVPVQLESPTLGKTFLMDATDTP